MSYTKFTYFDTTENGYIYTSNELKNRTIRTVVLGNTILTEDQYTLVSSTFTIIETDIKVETKTRNLVISHQWVKRN